MLSKKNSLLIALVATLVVSGAAGVGACQAQWFDTEALEAMILRLFVPGMLIIGVVVFRIVMVLRARNESHLLFDVARNWQTLPSELQAALWFVLLPLGGAVWFALASAICLDIG